MTFVLPVVPIFQLANMCQTAGLIRLEKLEDEVQLMKIIGPSPSAKTDIMMLKVSYDLDNYKCRRD